MISIFEIRDSGISNTLNRKVTNLYLKYVLFFFLLALSFTSKSNERNILVIHSYHQGLEWTDSISSGILSVFKQNTDFNIYFEYIDTKRNNTADYFNTVIELYRSQTSKIGYDAIIACDNAAYNFMLKYRDEFFPGVPVFYCGVNFLDRDELMKHEKFFGYEEIADHAGTIDLIQQIFPERKKVLIVNDQTLTGRSIRKELDEVLPKYENELEFEIIETFSIQELQDRVALLNDEYTIYLLVVNMDRLGNYVSYNKGIEIIRENTTVPIFGSWDFYLGKGIVGGAITKGFEQGRDVALLCYKYLMEQNDQISTYQKGKTSRCLDYNIMEQFKLENTKNLKGIKIINKPSVPTWQVLILKITIYFLLSILLVLFVYLRVREVQSRKLESLVELRTKELKTANQNLEKINKSKNEILGIVGHDLRSPIGNISSFSKLIIDQDDENDILDEQSREGIDIIYNLSSYMLRLVNNLLDISVIELGVLKLNRVEADYVAFIANEVAQYKALADSKQVAIEFSSEINQLRMLFDKVKLQQAFINIISNALKFSSPDDTIEVNIESNGNRVLTKIKDAGPGIPEEKLDVIFEKFEQLHLDSDIRNKGTGLGLSIVKGIIEAHKGKIYVKSELNVGSEFIYELPIC